MLEICKVANPKFHLARTLTVIKKTSKKGRTYHNLYRLTQNGLHFIYVIDTNFTMKTKSRVQNCSSQFLYMSNLTLRIPHNIISLSLDTHFQRVITPFIGKNGSPTIA